jgi:pimeloyl-ACP methyl ester carboxylesterase
MSDLEKSVLTTTGYHSVFYTSKDCLRLHIRDYQPFKPSNLPPLVCLSGLSRNASDFHRLALELSQDIKRPRRVVAFDYRGRGLSQNARDAASYTVQTEAVDIFDGLAALNIHKADFLGTSRGGLILMVMAVMRPAVLGRVILNDIGPKLENLGLLRIKTYLGQLETLQDWPAIDKLLKQRFLESFSSVTEADYIDFIETMFGSREHRPKLSFDKKLNESLKHIDASQAMPEIWPQFMALQHCPMDILHGANSDLLSAATAQMMAEKHPNARLHTIEGQAHAPLTNEASMMKLIKQILAR